MSKTIISLGLAMMLAVPATAWAQEEVAPSEADSSADASAADGSTSDATAEGADEASAATDADTSSDASADAGSEISAEASADSSADAGGEDTSGSDTASSDGSSYSDTSDESGSSDDGDSGDGLRFYVGAERAETTLDLSGETLQNRYGRDQLDGGSYLGRVGVRIAEGISIEGIGSFAPDDDKGGRDAKFTQIYGAYLVTTGTVMETVEVSGRVGYALVRAENATADEKFDNVSYGVEMALPLRVFSDSLPNVRLVGGGTVYSQERQARIYGWHYGLRYDFGF